MKKYELVPLEKLAETILEQEWVFVQDETEDEWSGTWEPVYDDQK